MRLERHLRIYAGVDVARALRCLREYLASPNARRVGYGSFALYTYTDGENEALMIYTTETAYIVRKAE